MCIFCSVHYPTRDFLSRVTPIYPIQLYYNTLLYIMILIYFYIKIDLNIWLLIYYIIIQLYKLKVDNVKKKKKKKRLKKKKKKNFFFFF